MLYATIEIVSFFSLAPQLVRHGNIDFLVSDYLAEITMSLLTAIKHKQPVRSDHYNICTFMASHNHAILSLISPHL